MKQNRYFITCVWTSVVVACLTPQSRAQVYIDGAAARANALRPTGDGPESTGCSFNKRCQVFFVGVNKIVFDDVPPLVIDEEVLLDCNECAVDCVTSSCLGTLSVARTDTGTVSSSSSVGRSFSAEVNPALGGSIGIEMEQSFVDGNSNSTSISHELSVECGSTSIPPRAHVRYWLKSYKNHRTACATFRYCGEAQYTADIACGTYAPGPWFWAGVCCDNQEAVDIDGQKGSGGLGLRGRADQLWHIDWGHPIRRLTRSVRPTGNRPLSWTVTNRSAEAPRKRVRRPVNKSGPASTSPSRRGPGRARSARPWRPPTTASR